VEDGSRHVLPIWNTSRRWPDFDRPRRSIRSRRTCTITLPKRSSFARCIATEALESELVDGQQLAAAARPAQSDCRDGAAVPGRGSEGVRIGAGALQGNPNDRRRAGMPMGITYGLRANYFSWSTRIGCSPLRDATAARKSAQRVQRAGSFERRRAAGARVVTTTRWAACRAFYACWDPGRLSWRQGPRIRTIEDVAAHGKEDRIEAEIFLARSIAGSTSRAGAAHRRRVIRSFPRNYLLRFERSGIYAAVGDGQGAIAGVEEVARLKQEGRARL